MKSNEVDPRLYLSGLSAFGMKPGLERIRFLMGELGNPEKGFPAVHVAGTNGKGSTVAFISSILKKAGFKVGMYTSPHIVSFTERIRINGQDISSEDMAELLSEIRSIAEHSPRDIGYPTVFEVLTAAAFCHFARHKVDVAVIEVGMGGRWDATNIIDPLVSVITRIGLDHQDKLGDTVTKIAREKAGIIKEGKPVISAPQVPEAASVLAETASALSAPLYLLAPTQIEVVEANRSGVRFNLSLPGKRWDGLITGLMGRHQALNAAVSVGALSVLESWYGFEVGEGAVRSGLRETKWPGRLEVVGENPLILLDGAHNPDGVSVLAGALQEIFAKQRLILVLGVLAEKAVDAMLEQLIPLAQGVVCTAPAESRTPALKPEELRTRVQAMALKLGHVLPIIEALDITHAVARASELARSLGAAVCVTGSLYLVGEVRGMIKGAESAV